MNFSNNQSYKGATNSDYRGASYRSSSSSGGSSMSTSEKVKFLGGAVVTGGTSVVGAMARKSVGASGATGQAVSSGASHAFSAAAEWSGH